MVDLNSQAVRGVFSDLLTRFLTPSWSIWTLSLCVVCSRIYSPKLTRTWSIWTLSPCVVPLKITRSISDPPIKIDSSENVCRFLSNLIAWFLTIVGNFLSQDEEPYVRVFSRICCLSSNHIILLTFIIWPTVCLGSMIRHDLISPSGTVLLPFFGWNTSNYCVPQPQNPAIQRQQWRAVWLVSFSDPPLWLVLTLSGIRI